MNDAVTALTNFCKKLNFFAIDKFPDYRENMAGILHLRQ